MLVEGSPTEWVASRLTRQDASMFRGICERCQADTYLEWSRGAGGVIARCRDCGGRFVIRRRSDRYGTSRKVIPAELLALYPERTSREIADLSGASESTVRRCLIESGVRMVHGRPLDPGHAAKLLAVTVNEGMEARRRIFSLWDAGATVTQIQAAMRYVAIQSVHRHLRHNPNYSARESRRRSLAYAKALREAVPEAGHFSSGSTGVDVVASPVLGRHEARGS